MPTIFNVQADVIAGYQASGDIVRSMLQVGLSDDVHPVVLTYLDHLGSWLGASPSSMQTVRTAVCCHGSIVLRRLGLMVGIKPVDTARLLADCSGGVAWLTWEAALLECFSHEDVALFQQEAGRLIGLKSIVIPHTRELVSAIGATAPRLGTVSFPEHYAKMCGAMRQALFAATDTCPAGVAEPPAITDVVELLTRVAEAYKEQLCIVIRGQQSIGWLAATLTWIYGETVQVLAAGTVVRECEKRGRAAKYPLICVELSDDETSCLTLDYRVDREGLISAVTTQPRTDTLASFGPKRSRADQYFTNWLACTSPVSPDEAGPLAAAAAQLTCGLLRTIHLSNEGGEGEFRAETKGSGRQLVNVLRLPGSYSDVRRVREFFTILSDGAAPQPPTSQIQLILAKSSAELEASEELKEGASTTALAFLARVPSLREVYGRMIREMLRIGIRGENDCHCVLPGSGPEAWLPSAHESHCGVYQAASLGVELVAACICSLLVEGPTSPRLAMFDASPLRWAISKAIEQSVLTGSALISGADMMKSVLVIAGYSGNYNYGPLIVSSGGQALVLAALHDMTLSPVSIGRVMAFPGAVLHRGQYYERLVVGPCRRLGGDILREVCGMAVRKPSAEEKTALSIAPNSEGAAESIDIVIRETSQELLLVVRSRQANGTIKEHDMWHCITAALTANMLGGCSHEKSRPYTPRAAETVRLVGTGTNLGRVFMDNTLTIALVHESGLDRLLACGVGVNLVVQSSGCLQCAVQASKQVGYSYLVV
ncbi:MAG: hypothetical protein M1839_003594 [Geoglossum umbratile]|nr:MAG: hypothetical protein M1839_003594 [Geoglossum umbratile]